MTSLLVSFQPGVEPLVEREIKRADARAELRESLEPGLWRVLPAPDDPLAMRLCEALRRDPPIAIRHLHPASIEARVGSLEGLVTALTPLVADLVALAPGAATWSVQTRLVGQAAPQLRGPAGAPLRAHDVNDALVAALAPGLEARGLTFDRRRPARVISVALVGERVFAGASTTRANLSAWPGGMARLAGGDDALSRAKKKLLEALEVFAVHGLELPRMGRALDLGAAPGGWTQALLEAGLSVTAVDPAALDPRLVSPALEHFRGTTDRFLASRPRGGFAIIVNDMRMDARDAARLLLDVEPLLAPSGVIVTTLKLPERAFLPVLDQALAVLREAYVVRARQLFHNRSEITALLTPRAH